MISDSLNIIKININKINISKANIRNINFELLLVIAVYFFLPVSSTGKSIAMGLIVSWVILNPIYRSSLVLLLKSPWFLSGLVFFISVCIACFWGVASYSQKLLELGKYSKILYLPLIVVAVSNDKNRNIALHAFLAAMALTVSVSVIKWIGWSTYHGDSQQFIFRNHIMTSEMMATAAYFSLLLYQECKKPLLKWGYLVFCGICSFQVLFINTGRSGYIMYFVLIVLWLIQKYYHAISKLLLMGLSLGVFLGICYQCSPVLQKQYQITYQQLQHSNKLKNNSIGFRIRFHEYAKELWSRAPIIGNGAGSFTALYHLENPIPERGDHLLEPHSQYWLIASEMGIIGELLLLLYLGLLLRSGWRNQSMRLYALGSAIPFLLGSFTDSLLFYSGSGYFFLLMMALCLGTECKKRQN